MFSPLSLGPLDLRNRIVVAPMCQYSADDSNASDWHLMHLGQLAISGAGLLILEATAVESRGRITFADLGLYRDANERALAKVLTSVRGMADIPLGIQLAHAGRKASTQRPWDGGGVIASSHPDGWQTISASDQPFEPGTPAPVAMSEADIDAVVDAFAQAARRADRLGLDLIEIHGAHGYLLHQFLSPLSNARRDAYGGSLANRMRLALRVFDATREAVSERVSVGMRISATDWAEGGWDLEQSIALAKALDARGCHFIHVSSGGLTPQQQIAAGPNYQVPFAQAIKTEVAMPVIAVGLITEPAQAEQILAEGCADAVALARAMLYNPRWPWHAAAELGDTVTAPPQYLRSAPHGAKALFQAP
nr:NADH:flavin oxidoreductase/NADH oxidase [Oleiagrimonas sp. C23AA]